MSTVTIFSNIEEFVHKTNGYRINHVKEVRKEDLYTLIITGHKKYYLPENIIMIHDNTGE